MILTDLNLSRRLERCEGRANVAFVEARARLEPDVHATWIEVDGAYAMFDGAGSPLTQTFGLGIFETPSDADFERIESFFEERGSATHHEVSPLATGMVEKLVARGYHPIELTSVMFMEMRTDRIVCPPGVRISADGYPDLAAEGWSEFPEVAPYIRGFARVTAAAEGSTPFIADVDGRPAATGMLIMQDGVALLAGASTIPSARKRGAQRALLEARLSYAADHGCDIAMMCAAPGSASQRNAERQGFRIAYTRIKWERRIQSGA